MAEGVLAVLVLGLVLGLAWLRHCRCWRSGPVWPRRGCRPAWRSACSTTGSCAWNWSAAGRCPRAGGGRPRASTGSWTRTAGRRCCPYFRAGVFLVILAFAGLSLVALGVVKAWLLTR
jgi:hypothetical protein